MHTDAIDLTWFLAGGVVLPAIFVVLAFRSPSPRQLRRWAEGCGVTLTVANRELVRSHLGRVRRVRSLTALPFWWLWPAPLVFGAGFPRWLASPAPAVAAYLIGALLAELSFAPDGTGTVRHASLSPRRTQDYRPQWIRVLPWVLFAGAVAVLLVSGRSESFLTPTSAAAIVALGALVAGIATAATRPIVRRPQRTGDADLLAADDGLRATAIALTSGVTLIAALAAMTASIQAAMPTTVDGWVPLALASGVLACQALSLGALTCIVRQETWGYRRRHRQTTLVAAS